MNFFEQSDIAKKPVVDPLFKEHVASEFGEASRVLAFTNATNSGNRVPARVFSLLLGNRS